MPERSPRGHQSRQTEWRGFRHWAEAQFGPRPDAPDIREVEEAEVRAATLRELWQRQRSWDDQWNAALYAWNVTDDRKGADDE